MKVNLDKLTVDMIRYPKLAEDLFKDFFYGEYELDDIRQNELYDSLYHMYNKNDQYIEPIKYIVSNLKKQYKENGKDILNGMKTHHRIRMYNEKLDTWFLILPIVICMMIYNTIISLYMYINGYLSQRENGYRIWYNKQDPMRGVPLIYFDCSIGHRSIDPITISQLSKKYNMIIIEYSGLSRYQYGGDTITIAEIAERSIEMIRSKFNVKQINMIGQNAGSMICNMIINKYPNMIDNYFCIDGGLFYHRMLYIFKELRHERSLEEILMMPIYEKNMYVQFFIKRMIDTDCFIYDMEKCETMNIYLFYAETYGMYDLEGQIEYAKMKRIPLKYYIFRNMNIKKDLFNNRIKKALFEEIQTIYESYKFVIR